MRRLRPHEPASVHTVMVLANGQFQINNLNYRSFHEMNSNIHVTNATF